MSSRKTAQDVDQELLILFDAYVHGSLDRRGFLARAQKFAIGGLIAPALLSSLSPDVAMGQVDTKDDARGLHCQRDPTGLGPHAGLLQAALAKQFAQRL